MLRMLAALAVFLFVLSVTPADACRCVPPGPVCATFWRTPVVFVGIVVAIAPADNGSPAMAVHFKVDQRGRGVGSDSLVVFAEPQNGMNCGYTFHQGERYIVYANKAPDGALTTNACTRTRAAAQAADDLAFLAEVNGPPRGVRIFGHVQRIENDLVSFDRHPYAVEGAEVRITGEQAARTVMTDAAGDYDVRDLPRGAYTVVVVPPKGLALAGPPLPLTQYNATVPKVSLMRPSECAELWSNPRTDSRIDGTLLDNNGQPADGEHVELVSVLNAGSDKPIPNVSVRTAADGSFTFAFIAPGKYLVGVNLAKPPNPSELDRRTYYPGKIAPAEATVITIEPGSRVRLSAFRLHEWPANRVISGTVMWSDGVPAPHATLSLIGAAPRPVAVDDWGRFNASVPYGARFQLHAQASRVFDGQNENVTSQYYTVDRNDRDSEIVLTLKTPEYHK